MRFRKPELIPLLFIVVAVGVCVTLGVWQLERLAWKESLMAAIETAQAEPTLTTLPKDLAALDYRNVELKGQFLQDKALHRVGSRQGERPGFVLLVPLKLKDGRVILVDRGYTPADALPDITKPSVIQGILRPVRGRRAFFIPDNQPARNLWLYEDIAAMSSYTQLTLLPLVVEATGSYKKGVYPIPNTGKIVLRNDHFGYAITWFSLALVGIVLFGVYYRARA
jgi:surfeit locus 1 family protein